MEQMDAVARMDRTDAIRMRRSECPPLGNLDRLRLGRWASGIIDNYRHDVDFLLSEIDRMTSERDAISDELVRLRARELARVNAHLHIDTEPKRRKTVNALPYIGITTVRGVLQEGGCIAIDLKGTEALITAQNVAVGRLRPGTKNELRDAGELPIMARGPGSFVMYSQHVFLHDPAECKV